MNEKIRLGISTCLMGEAVRYDGGHKLDRFLMETLGQYVEYVPVCPEVESGMSTPREAMRLVGTVDNPKLITIKSKADLTEVMLNWSTKRLAELEKEELCGFIFMKNSPSSGMERVKVYDHNGVPSKNGVGLFAKRFMDRFPLLPVEENGRLHDPGLRENFIERIFVLRRWRRDVMAKPTRGAIVDFHTRHKLLIMAHSSKHLTELGRLVAGAVEMDDERLYREYIEVLMPALRLPATVKRNVDVLQHALGYFKKDLTSAEKQEVLELIENYHRFLVPLIVPITMLKYFSKKYDKSYLLGQYYFDPHPIELALRNHV